MVVAADGNPKGLVRLVEYHPPIHKGMGVVGTTLPSLLVALHKPCCKNTDNTVALWLQKRPIHVFHGLAGFEVLYALEQISQSDGGEIEVYCYPDTSWQVPELNSRATESAILIHGDTSHFIVN